MKVYISGGISKIKDKFGWNKVIEAFEEGKQLAIVLGFDEEGIINPCDYEKEGLTQEGYMVYWNKVIHEEVGMMIMLRGWEESAGATQEYKWALELGISIMYM